MIESKQAEELGNGLVDCATEIKKVCAACGYDLTPEEIEADTCADCGAPLNLAQHVTVYATSVPAFAVTFGDV
jgi:rRNA maturation endonuclease Nob1